MPRGSWLADLRPQAGAEIPAGLRFIGAALSGAALSLSYTGLHLSIYSWVCIGILISSLFGGRPRVALGCGFLHGLLFVLTSVPWIATVLTVHGGLSVAGGWGVLLLIAIAWGILVGGFAWAVHRLSRQSTELACLGAPFIWVTFEFIRAYLPEISFPWNLLGYPAAANLCLVQLTTITGIYGLSFLVAGFNALLSWTIASNTLTLGRRIACGVAATAILLSAALAGPRLAPQAQAHHFARAVNRTPRIGFRRTPQISTKSDESASPLPRKNQTFSSGLRRPRLFRSKIRNSQGLPRRWRSVSGTHSLRGPSNGKHRWIHRAWRPMAVLCRTTARCFLTPKASVYSYTTKFIWFRSVSTSPFH